LIRKIKLEPIPFPKDEFIFGLFTWPRASENSENFIKGCLELDENQRLTWDQVFLHPLFKDCFNWKKMLSDLDS